MINIVHSRAKNLLEMLEEAEKGMKPDNVYDTSNIQIIWFQYAKDCNSIEISMDGGDTWTCPPFVDSGKWSYYYNDKGEYYPWLFRLIKMKR
ncbi:hypothetical protein [Lacrimispora amygdalina]|uniref:hypothetical protein n=1 Tax=Lacrimispora amygdalina TaxID=253257 RepID=UPI000BE3BA69|nr:hypothetical protein [Lacrimispora amygdalina]